MTRYCPKPAFLISSPLPSFPHLACWGSSKRSRAPSSSFLAKPSLSSSSILPTPPSSLSFTLHIYAQSIDQQHNLISCPLSSASQPKLGSTHSMGHPGTVEYVLNMRERMKSFCIEFADCSVLNDGRKDPLWQAMQEEARIVAQEEPVLASYLFTTIINQKSLGSALAYHLANKLQTNSIPNTLLFELVLDALAFDDSFALCVHEDLLAIMERDPACTRFIDAFLYYKGFHALQSYRVAHCLWKEKKFALAYYLQSQVSKELHVDIHPAARIGPGAFIDHATGVVIGETAVIGKNVSMLHHVTLGGSGRLLGDRHPKLGDNVLIGAGATILGNIHIGSNAKIGACSLVLQDVGEGWTVVGVPAKEVGGGTAVPTLGKKEIEVVQDGSNVT